VSAWDTEWAAARAGEALRYPGRNSPACLGNLRVLDKNETPRTRPPAMRGDREAFLEVLRFRRSAA
jgi:hypothetical protein